MRIDRIISNSGCGSRKEIKKMIKFGLITVDGMVINDCGTLINPDESDIRVNGNQLQYVKYVYIMMNKPKGVISATCDNKHKTVIDILPQEFRQYDLFPVGRLDIDTEGLLLLTNDGGLAHNILAPKKHVPKKYYALIEGVVSDEDIEKFGNGILLKDGYKSMPAKLTIKKSDSISEIELIIYEGKFHQVKRMFESVDKKVKYLKRISMGSLCLDGNLGLGDFRKLTFEELSYLKNV